MNELAKDVFSEVRKELIKRIITWVGAILISSGATAKWWGVLLAIPDSQISSLRYWLSFSGALLLVAVAWLLFIRTLQKLRSVEKELADALKRPHRFQDDCTFDPKLGVYRHKTKPGLFCGSCTPNDIESPLKEMENGWHCLVDSKHWHPNPDYKTPPSSIYRSGRSVFQPRRLGPSDF